MQESVSMHKSPTPVRHSLINQARSKEEEKESQERQRPGGWWKERQPNKTKTHRRSWNKAYLGTANVNKGEDRWTSLATECDPLPQTPPRWTESLKSWVIVSSEPRAPSTSWKPLLGLHDWNICGNVQGPHAPHPEPRCSHLVHSSVLFPPWQIWGDPEEVYEDRDRMQSEGRCVPLKSRDWGHPLGIWNSAFSIFKVVPLWAHPWYHW